MLLFYHRLLRMSPINMISNINASAQIKKNKLTLADG